MKNVAVWVIAACCVIAVGGGAAFWWRSEEKAAAAEAARVALAASEKAKTQLAAIDAAKGVLRAPMARAMSEFKAPKASYDSLAVVGLQVTMLAFESDIVLAKVPGCLALAQSKASNVVKQFQRFYDRVYEKDRSGALGAVQGVDEAYTAAMREIESGCTSEKKTLATQVIA